MKNNTNTTNKTTTAKSNTSSSKTTPKSSLTPKSKTTNSTNNSSKSSSKKSGTILIQTPTVPVTPNKSSSATPAETTIIVNQGTVYDYDKTNILSGVKEIINLSNVTAIKEFTKAVQHLFPNFKHYSSKQNHVDLIMNNRDLVLQHCGNITITEGEPSERQKNSNKVAKIRKKLEQQQEKDKGVDYKEFLKKNKISSSTYFEIEEGIELVLFKNNRVVAEGSFIKLIKVDDVTSIPLIDVTSIVDESNLDEIECVPSEVSWEHDLCYKEVFSKVFEESQPNKKKQKIDLQHVSSTVPNDEILLLKEQAERDKATIELLIKDKSLMNETIIKLTSELEVYKSKSFKERDWNNIMKKIEYFGNFFFEGKEFTDKILNSAYGSSNNEPKFKLDDELVSITSKDKEVLNLNQRQRVMNRLMVIIKTKYQVFDNNLKYKMPGTKRGSKDNDSGDWNECTNLSEQQIEKIISGAKENCKVFRNEAVTNIRKYIGKSLKFLNRSVAGDNDKDNEGEDEEVGEEEVGDE